MKGGEFMTLLEAYNLPFAVSGLLLICIAIAQALGAGDMFDGGDADIGDTNRWNRAANRGRRRGAKHEIFGTGCPGN